jgi:hypothetical protein
VPNAISPYVRGFGTVDEGSAELVDYPRAELAEHLHSAEAVEHLHLAEIVDQQL